MWEDVNNDYLDDLADTLDPFHVNDALFGNRDRHTSFDETMTAALLDADPTYDPYLDKSDDFV